MATSKNSNITSLGVGATNRCNLNCPHCYSRPLAKDDLYLEDIKKLLLEYPNTKKINFGTGESFLNSDFLAIAAYCKNKRIKLALTTNGTTVNQLSDEQLSWFDDIDFSLDFPSAKLHDKWRGKPGLFNKVMIGLTRCQKLDINTSIALCLMSNNYHLLPYFRPILDHFKIFLRINIYKPTPSPKFSLTYNQFWQAVELLAKNFKLVSNSEPVLATVAPTIAHGSPCGERSLRIHPDKTVSPCVYLKGKAISLNKFSRLKSFIPEFCRNCQFVSACRGGCLSRRILSGNYQLPDEFCPLYKNKPIPKIKFKTAEEKKFIHAGYLCTIIVK